MDARTVTVYEEAASEWLRRRGGQGDGLGRRFRDLIGPGPVVDLGCGVGRYLGELGEGAAGLDATMGMLMLARQAGRPLVRGDLEALPLATGSLAGVFARHSFLHLPKDRLPGALAEARRVLRQGGTLLATMLEGGYEGYALPDDDFPGRYFACWEASELRQCLRRVGFGHVEVSPLERPRGRPDLIATARR